MFLEMFYKQVDYMHDINLSGSLILLSCIFVIVNKTLKVAILLQVFKDSPV